MKIANDITAVILAGGKGSRLHGADKGLVPVCGKPLVAHLIERLVPQCSRLLISANRNIESYREYGYPVITDQDAQYPGPLAGIHSAMAYLQKGLLLTVPCDSPLLPPDYVQRMANAITHGDNASLAVAYDGETIQPVFSLLSCSLQSSLQQYLESGERKVHRWIMQQHPALADFSDIENMFINMNTAKEKAMLESLLERES